MAGGSLRPFTVEHFRRYAGLLVLDNGKRWVPEDWQLEFAADLFAGTRELWLVVGEGNGKTTLLAGLALYHGDYTPDAKVCMAAASRDQCGLLLGQAIGFVLRSPGFEKRFKTFDGYRRIDCLRTNGEILVFAADDRTGDGVIPTLALCDELHRHRNMRLYRTWYGKHEKRDMQIVAISTAGEPGSEFEITRERQRTEAPDITVNGCHIRAASEHMVLHDWGLRPGDDVDDLELVASANPFSGITVEKLRAKRSSPAMTAGHWSRFVCNLATRTEGAAVGEAEWLAAETPDPGLKGERCEVGLDLGWKWDATALVPVFKRPEGWLFGKSRVIVPPRDGNSLEPDTILAALREIHGETPVDSVTMDPSAGGEQLASQIEREIGCRVVSYSQKTAPMAAAAGRFMETLRDGRQKHVQDRDFTRHVLNAVAAELPDGTFKFVRPSDSRSAPSETPRREIDALIAGAIVLSTAMGGSYEGPLMEVL